MTLNFNLYYLGSVIETDALMKSQSLRNKNIFLILHGLFGRGKNWHHIAKSLSSKVSEIFITIDQRNHGKNFSSDDLTYSIMVRDLLTFIRDLELKKISLIGHSMGGKVAMMFSLLNKNLVRHLIIVDIAPVKYKLDQIETVDHLLDIDLKKITSRKLAEQKLEEKLNNRNLTLFLLQNLVSKKNSYEWSINLNTIKSSMNNLRDFPISNSNIYEKPVLCIYGQKSNYVTKENMKHFRQFFPNVIFVQIKNTGHWLHAEKPNDFVEKIVNYLILNV